jgi:hypothetical protein
MMTTLFRAVVDRLKVLLAASAAQELEADALARHAERAAELHRQADALDREGRPEVAAELRRRAAALDPDRPAGTVLPAIAHLRDGTDKLPLPPAATPGLPLTASPRRKGR